MRRPGNMSKSKGQKELDEYIFTRPEMAKLLGISTNALRMRMRKGKCDLEYRFDGSQFKFKRPPKERVITMSADHPQTSHEKVLRDYDKKVQKRYNRGATHKGKGKYPNEVFKLQNEMKIMNHIQGRFKSEEHRKRFEQLNEGSLKKIDKEVRKDLQRRAESTFYGWPKYGGMVYGSAKWYENPYEIDAVKPPDTSFHITGKPYGELSTKPEEKEEEVNYYWNEPKEKDPGEGYKPGKFPKLDEAIRNSKKK